MSMQLTKASQARIIQYLLVQGGVGVAFDATGDWRVFSHLIDPEPDQGIWVFSTQGIINGRSQRTGEYSEHYGIQVRTRGKNPEEAHLKAQEIEDYFSRTVKRTTVVIPTTGSFLIHAITKTSPLIPLGREEKNRRSEYSSNFTATIEEL